MAGFREAFASALTSPELLVPLVLAVAGYVGLGLRQGSSKAFSFWREWRFSHYAGSIGLEKEDVMRSVRRYVRQCGTESDPSALMDMAESLRTERKDLFKWIDDFISPTSADRHLFIFADCGMGKTSFLINYFYRRRLRLKVAGTDLVLITLANTASFAKAEQVSQAKRVNTVLLIDALDEDPLVLDGIEKRVSLLLENVKGFKRVIITCRSQFFENDEQIPTRTGMLRSGPTSAGTSKELTFRRIYIAPFDAKQIKKYLRVQLPGIRGWRRRLRAQSLVAQVRNLALRPMLLAHIADILEQESVRSAMTLADIYQALASAWVEREKHWVDSKELFLFSQKFASNLYENRQERGGEFCDRSEVIALAESWGVNIRVEFLTGRSLLNRMSDGRCKFAHRSILEFFVIDNLIAGGGSSEVELTGEMSRFLLDRLGVKLTPALTVAKWGSSAHRESAEERLGYPTNFNLYTEDGSDIPVNALNNLEVEIPGTSLEKVMLGEQIRYMTSGLEDRSSTAEIRLNLDHSSDSSAQLHIGIWYEDQVILSLVRLDRHEWNAVTGSTWREKEIFSAVGRYVSAGFNATRLRWKATTRCDLPGKVGEVDSSSGCQAVAITRGEGGRSNFRVISAFAEARGPLAGFGILKGGHGQQYLGRRFFVLKAPSRGTESWGRIIESEMALVPASEKWPDRDKRR
jgi:hypothetical protein